MELNSANLGLIFTLGGLFIAYLSYSLGKKKDDKQETKEDVSIQMEFKSKIEILEKEMEMLKTKDNPTLEYIKNGIDDIKTEIKDMKCDQKSTNDKINELNIKYAALEASLKSEHKRLNEHDLRFSDFEKERK